MPSGRLAALRFFSASTMKASATETPAKPEVEGGHRALDTRGAAAKLWPLSIRAFRRALSAPAQKRMQVEGDFVGVGCAPDNDALELDGIPSEGADFHQLSFYDLRVSHRTSGMAHGGHHWHISWLVTYQERKPTMRPPVVKAVTSGDARRKRLQRGA